MKGRIYFTNSKFLETRSATKWLDWQNYASKSHVRGENIDVQTNIFVHFHMNYYHEEIRVYVPIGKTFVNSMPHFHWHSTIILPILDFENGWDCIQMS